MDNRSFLPPRDMREPRSASGLHSTVAGGFALVALVALIAASVSCQGRIRTGKLSANRSPSRVELRRVGDPFEVVLSRGDDSWSLELDEERRYPVNETRVSLFVKTLSESTSIVRVADGDAIDYGIGEPDSFEVLIFADGNGGSPESQGFGERLRFGDRDATGEWVYFCRGDESAVFRTPSRVVPMLSVRASSWVELSPFREKLASCDVQEVTVGGTSFRAGTDGRVEEFGTALGSLVAIDITNIPAAPALTVNVAFGDATSASIVLSPLGGDWILADAASARSYVCSGSSIRELLACLGISLRY